MSNRPPGSRRQRWKLSRRLGSSSRRLHRRERRWSTTTTSTKSPSRQLIVPSFPVHRRSLNDSAAESPNLVFDFVTTHLELILVKLLCFLLPLLCFPQVHRYI